MFNAVALRISFLVVELSAAVLLSLLLITKYFYKNKRHPLVFGLLFGDFLRTLVFLIPALAPHAFNKGVNGFVNDTPVARWCAVGGVLSAYFLTVKIAFSVSFTTFILLVVRRAEAPDEVPIEFPRRISVTLAIAPYIWSLPNILLPLPVLIRSAGKQPPALFNEFICVLRYRPFFIMAGYVLWIPCAVAILLSMAIAFYVWRFYHRHHSIVFSRRTADSSLVLRFGGMTVIILTTAIFFAFVSGAGRPEITLIRTNSFWQSISTLMGFCIFTRRPAIQVWKGWLCAIFRCSNPQKGDVLPHEPETLRRPEDPPWIMDSFPPEILPEQPSRLRRIWQSGARPKIRSNLHRLSSTQEGHELGQIGTRRSGPLPPLSPRQLQRVHVPRDWPASTKRAVKGTAVIDATNSRQASLSGSESSKDGHVLQDMPSSPCDVDLPQSLARTGVEAIIERQPPPAGDASSHDEPIRTFGDTEP